MERTFSKKRLFDNSMKSDLEQCRYIDFNIGIKNFFLSILPLGFSIFSASPWVKDINSTYIRRLQHHFYKNFETIV